MQGSIAVSSELGRGTTFTVTLPIDQVNQESQSTAKGETDDSAFQDLSIAHFKNQKPKLNGQLKVLVVDDDPDARELLTRHFEFLGAKAISCENGEQALKLASDGRHALEVLQEFTPDLIFVDLAMPKKDQLVFLRALRQNRRLLHLPAVGINCSILDPSERDELKRQDSSIITKDASFEQQLQEVLNYVR